MKITQQHLELKLLDYKNMTLEQISSKMNVSIGKAHSLKEQIEKNGVNQKRYEFNKAIIWAAGWGSRLNPITLEVPKPLVKVKGIPMIETNIKALIRSGINDITIVTGNMHEKFEVLIKKYDLNVIKNEKWMSYNNISSAAVAKELLKENIYLIDGDLLITDDFKYNKYLATSTAYSVLDNKKGELHFIKYGKKVIGYEKIEKDEIVEQYIGIFGIMKNDVKLLNKMIQSTFPHTPAYDDRYWFEILIDQCKAKKIEMLTRTIPKGEVIEIDTVQDLIEVDESYERMIYE